MKRRAVLLVTVTALTMLLLSAPAFAQQTPFTVDAPTCTSVTVSGSGLPDGAKTLVIRNPVNVEKPLKTVQVQVTNGSLQTTVKDVALSGLTTVEAVLNDGANLIIAGGHDLDAAFKKKCAASAGKSAGGALPFTGPARAPILLGGGVLLLVAGGLLLTRHTYRGRHQASW